VLTSAHKIGQGPLACTMLHRLVPLSIDCVVGDDIINIDLSFCQIDRMIMAHYCIRNGVDINVRDSHGRTPLMVAAQKDSQLTFKHVSPSPFFFFYHKLFTKEYLFCVLCGEVFCIE